MTLVTVEYGGDFLLCILKGTIPECSAAPPQFPFFRAGHAHAGVWVILGLAAQPLIDTTRVTDRIKLLMHILFFASPLLISGAFFAGALTMADGRPAGADRRRATLTEERHGRDGRAVDIHLFWRPYGPCQAGPASPQL